MKNIKNYVYIAFFLLAVTMQSCREDEVEAVELDRAEYTSYNDLFVSFWDTMNNNYNYLSEERNWDDVYREFNPKFEALKTFGDKKADPELARKEMNLAFKYFADIITDIKDKHFRLTVTLPNPSVPNLNSFGNSQGRKTQIFKSGVKYDYSEESGYLPISKSTPILNRFTIYYFAKPKINDIGLYYNTPVFAGFLKTDPETMYLQLKSFDITTEKIIGNFLELSEPVKANVSEKLYDDFKKLDATTEETVRGLINQTLNNFDEFLLDVRSSDVYKEYLDAVNTFKETEKIDKLIAVKGPFNAYVNQKFLPVRMNSFAISQLNDAYNINLANSDEAVSAFGRIINSFNKILADRQESSNFFVAGKNIAKDLTQKLDDKNKRAEFYKNVLNPLTEGKVKKLILDLRGNTGGAVVDTKNFIERFVTKQATWGYERTKEGNGRFNYSPWIKEETKPHKFGIKKEIPIIVLMDKKSISMAEACAMILRSQGKHVKIIGDYSAGGTASLAGNDDYNGGYEGNNIYLNFYMPATAFKDANGEIIEGVGVTPDIRIAPYSTWDEIFEVRRTRVDIVFDRALEEIRKMN